MVRSSCTDDRLPSINWKNKYIKILGFQIGNVNPKANWHDSLEGLRMQKLLINVSFQTWQAKSLLAKSKLLPQITYNAHTYPLNKTTRNIIESEFLNYLTNNPTISLSMRSLQRPINDGGIKFPNPGTYCNLFYISILFQYFKTREKNTSFNPVSTKALKISKFFIFSFTSVYSKISTQLHCIQPLLRHLSF